MLLKFPKYVINALETLENGGYKAYAVGGAVRDLIMGKTPFDYDITTDAEPNDVIGLFPKTVPTGIKHGTVTVVTSEGNIEITTFRSDEGYTDHRKPDGVKFIKSIETDLLRRDFTVNSICWSLKNGILDINGGIEDINKRIIRSIGNPEKRFSEDALRIMRAFRFSAQLGFTIEENTYNAALKLKDSLKLISAERIASETVKTFLSNEPQRISPLILSGAFCYYGIPPVKVDEKISRLPLSFPLRYAAFLQDAEKVKYSLKALKLDNETVLSAVSFAECIKKGLPETKYDVKVIIKNHGSTFTADLITYFGCCGFDTAKVDNYFREITDNKETVSLKELEVGGDDLKKLGLKGEEIGKALNLLLDLVMKETLDNKKDNLLNYLKNLM